MSVFSSTSQKPFEEVRCRLSLFGAESTGKTKIVERLLQMEFNEEHVPTIENYHEIMYRFSNISLTVEIVDTSGRYQFPDMRKLNMQRSDMVVLVFDLTDLTTFDEVERLYGITRELSQGLVIIVGAKDDIAWGQPKGETSTTDLTTDVIPDALSNTMTHPEWKEFIEHFVDAQEDDNLVYISCSAKTGVHIDAIIDRGVSELYPEIEKKHANCPVSGCRSFTQHTASDTEYGPNGHPRFQNVYSHLSTFIKDNQSQVTAFIKDNRTQVTSFIKESHVIERMKENQSQVTSFLKSKVNLQRNDGPS